MEAAKRVSWHLVGWDDASFLEALPSFASQSWQDAQLVIVEEGGQRVVCHEQSQTTQPVVLRHATRLGFARAHNQAIAFSLARWPSESWHERFVIMLEPSVRVQPQTLESLIRAFADDPELMIAGPKMVRAIRRWSESDEAWLIEPTETIEHAGWMLTRGRRWVARASGAVDTGAWNGTQDVFAVEGCVILRASCLARLAFAPNQWLDPLVSSQQAWRDLCWRAHWLGMRVRCVGSSSAWFCLPPMAFVRSRAKRLLDWYGASATSRRLRDEETAILVWKNDPMFVRLPHLPWTLITSVRWIALAMIDPRLLLARARTILVWARAHARRRAIMRLRTLSFASVRSFFL